MKCVRIVRPDFEPIEEYIDTTEDANEGHLESQKSATAEDVSVLGTGEGTEDGAGVGRPGRYDLGLEFRYGGCAGTATSNFDAMYCCIAVSSTSCYWCLEINFQLML